MASCPARRSRPASAATARRGQRRTGRPGRPAPRPAPSRRAPARARGAAARAGRRHRASRPTQSRRRARRAPVRLGETNEAGVARGEATVADEGPLTDAAGCAQVRRPAPSAAVSPESETVGPPPFCFGQMGKEIRQLRTGGAAAGSPRISGVDVARRVPGRQRSAGSRESAGYRALLRTGRAAERGSRPAEVARAHG